MAVYMNRQNPLSAARLSQPNHSVPSTQYSVLEEKMTQVATYAKPLPQMEPEAKPYWEYLKQHELRIQRCNACQQFFFPPEQFCPHCLSDDVEWTQVSGKGTVYTTVTYHRAYTPAYEGEVPYNVS